MSDGAMVQVYGDLIVYRASGIGSYCLKQLIAARMQYDPVPTPTKMQEVYDSGTATEDRIIAQFAEENTWVVDEDSRQGEYDYHVTSKIVVRCHVDGIWERKGRRRIVEFKSQGEAEWNPPNIATNALWGRYLWQVSSAMHGSGLAADMVVVRRKENDHKRLDWYLVEFDEPPISEAEFRKRVLTVEAAAKNDKLPDQCDVALYPCPYYYLHGEVQRVNDANVKVPDEDLAALCVQHEEAKLAEKLAKRRKEDIRKAIEATVDGDKYEIESDRGLIKITFFNGSRKGLDLEAVKYEYPEIDWKLYETKTEYRGMRLTVPE